MRRLAPFILLALTSTALADGGRKHAGGGDTLEMRAVEHFVAAVLADRAGDLEKALKEYKEANELSPHANTFYNIADVQRRLEHYDKAVKSYRKYLELAPKAPDAAAVAKLIEQLERTTGRVYVDGDDLDGVIFMDGKLVGPSPQLIPLPDEEMHTFTRITPAGAHTTDYAVKRMQTAHLSLDRGSAQPGNVVFAGDRGLPNGLIDRALDIRVPSRMTLKPGRYEVRYHNNYACAPIPLQIPGGKAVTYVYFVRGDKVNQPSGGTCYQMRAIQTQVRFPP